MTSEDQIPIDPAAEEAPYLQLASALRDRISTGTYPPGRRIPSLPELENLSGLSRNTVFKAVELLREEGLIRSAPGRGMFVIKQDEDET